MFHESLTATLDMAVGPIILAFIGLLSVENNPTGIFGLAPNIILVTAFAVIISLS